MLDHGGEDCHPFLGAIRYPDYQVYRLKRRCFGKSGRPMGKMIGRADRLWQGQGLNAVRNRRWDMGGPSPDMRLRLGVE